LAETEMYQHVCDISEWPANKGLAAQGPADIISHFNKTVILSQMNLNL
jgi:hypothetical protein